MKIILLRHCERPKYDIGFFSNLTEEGIINSYLLVEKLEKLNIDYIFSSPFIRTLQTIYLYAKKHKKEIHVEYGLYEFLHNIYFSFHKWFYTLDDIKDHDKSLYKLINKKYKSIVCKDDFHVLEERKDVEKRIIKFFDELKSNDKYKNKTILMVSHQGTINTIKNLYFEKTEEHTHFDMGCFEEYEF
jgi:broad specificity phosphatase PhoE